MILQQLNIEKRAGLKPALRLVYIIGHIASTRLLNSSSVFAKWYGAYSP